jgi:DNA-binding PucR family transcriptional regulator
LLEERQLLAVVHGGRVCALVRDVPRRAGEDRSLRNATRLAVHVGRIEPSTHLGISAAVCDARQLVAAARDAADAAQLAAQRDVPWLSVDDVWAELVVARLLTALPASLTADHPLARLAEHDRRHRSDLGITVGTWLAHRRDTVTTARALMLHPNTLRYRLRRAQDVSGLDLSDSTQSVVSQLHFCRVGWTGQER